MAKTFLIKFLLFCSILLLPIVLGTKIDTHIIGGSEISTFFIPYQVSLRRRSSSASPYAHTCGGSLLDENTILTAAHCVYNRAASDFLVVAGSEYRADMDGVVTRVERILPHELYNASITDNDIALVFIFPPLPLTHEKIAPIQLAQAAPAEGTMATVSGWGDTTEGGFPSTHLQRTQVLVRESEKCQEDYYWRPITDGMLCAGYNGGGHDACNGDSGGPLVVNKQLVGIVSWGEGCARADFPGVYANVTHFLHWIAENRS